MRDTARQIGGLMMQSYQPEPSGSILEVDFMGETGSLREHAVDAAHFRSMTSVPAADEPWPVADGSVDLIISSWATQSDTASWTSFPRLCGKLKPGGAIYVTGLSNLTPEEQGGPGWRFHPDASLALKAWAQSRGFAIELVESFVAHCGTEASRQFCAVFRRPPFADSQTRYVFPMVSCTDVLTGEPRDVVDRKIAEHEEAEKARRSDEARMLEPELAEEQPATFTPPEPPSADDPEAPAYDEPRRGRPRSALRRRIAQLENDLESERDKCETMQGEVEETRTSLAEAQEQLKHARRARTEIEAIATSLSTKLRERFGETAELSRALLAEEDKAYEAQRKAHWFSAVQTVLLAPRPWWWQLMPANWRRQRELRALKQRDLFDAAAYIRQHPDVAASGQQALRHYMVHGIDEGRTF